MSQLLDPKELDRLTIESAGERFAQALQELESARAEISRLTALLEDRQGMAKLLANVITGEAFTYSMGREIRDEQTEFDTGEMTHFGIDGEIDLFVVADRLIAYLKGVKS